MSFVFVALGGALGAVARYAISLIPVKGLFPILQLCDFEINIKLPIQLSSSRIKSSVYRFSAVTS